MDYLSLFEAQTPAGTSAKTGPLLPPVCFFYSSCFYDESKPSARR